jgi:hypothetical protein
VQFFSGFFLEFFFPSLFFLFLSKPVFAFPFLFLFLTLLIFFSPFLFFLTLLLLLILILPLPFSLALPEYRLLLLKVLLLLKHFVTALPTPFSFFTLLSLDPPIAFHILFLLPTLGPSLLILFTPVYGLSLILCLSLTFLCIKTQLFPTTLGCLCTSTLCIKKPSPKLSFGVGESEKSATLCC